MSERKEIIMVVPANLKDKLMAIVNYWTDTKDVEVRNPNYDENDFYFVVRGSDWKWNDGISDYRDIMDFINENDNDVYCIAVNTDFETLEWGNKSVGEEVGIEYDFKLVTPFDSEGDKKWLVMDMEHFEGSDLSDLSDFEFEVLAKKKNGYIFTNADDFVSAFNSEIFTTDTHQLRIVGF